MSPAKELHGIFNSLGYDRCGGYCYKKVEKGVTYLIDNPFSGWDNENDQESFIVDFSCFIQMEKRLGYKSSGKITVELSTVYKTGDTIETVRSAEADLNTAISRLTTKSDS